MSTAINFPSDNGGIPSEGGGYKKDHGKAPHGNHGGTVDKSPRPKKKGMPGLPASKGTNPLGN